MQHPEPTREIRCPHCGGPARFEKPFEFIGGPTPKANSPLWQLPRNGAWFVRERFPSLLPWTGPDDYYRHVSVTPGGSERGVVQCLRCRDSRVHDMRWPDDAFWRWEIRGSVLWAFTREHARVLREFISRSHREPADFGVEFAGFWARLPSEFLRAQARDEIVRMAHLASLAVQRRYINHPTKDKYLLPEELLEDAHDCIRRVRTIPEARSALSSAAVQAVLDLEPLVLAVTDEVICSEHLVDGEPTWNAVRQQAARCLKAMDFDLAQWEKMEGLSHVG